MAELQELKLRMDHELQSGWSGKWNLFPSSCGIKEKIDVLLIPEEHVARR